MPKLTDVQSILLTTAAQQVAGSLLPPSASLAVRRDRFGPAVVALIKRGYAEQIDATDADRSWRSEGDRHVGAVITDAGRAAIGVEPVTASPEVPPSADAGSVPRTKSALVLTLLGREAGATLVELVAATGWLPHTTRAALTGLRKKGHAIDRGKRDEATCYRVMAAA